MNWTRKDEARSIELEHELKELAARRAAAMQKVVHLIDDCHHEGCISVEKVIKKADALRDALAPFDSGCRAKEAA